MNIKGVKPLNGFVITQETEDTIKTKSGILTQENTDDFLVHGLVVKSASKKYPEGTNIIYHILDTESFRDGIEAYSLLHEDKVKGIYELQ